MVFPVIVGREAEKLRLSRANVVKVLNKLTSSWTPMLNVTPGRCNPRDYWSSHFFDIRLAELSIHRSVELVIHNLRLLRKFLASHRKQRIDFPAGQRFLLGRPIRLASQ